MAAATVGLIEEMMAVEFVAVDGDEERLGGHLAGVGADGRDLDVGAGDR